MSRSEYSMKHSNVLNIKKFGDNRKKVEVGNSLNKVSLTVEIL